MWKHFDLLRNILHIDASYEKSLYIIDCNAFPQMIKEIILKNSHRKIKYKYFHMHQVINNLSQILQITVFAFKTNKQYIM